MKSYDEMAESVLRRYSEYKAMRKRRLKTAAGVGITVCCIGVIALAGEGIRVGLVRGTRLGLPLLDGKTAVTTAPVTDSDGQTVSVRKCGETDEFDCEQIEAPAPVPDVPYDEDPQVQERPREVEDEPAVTIVSTGEHGADTEPDWTPVNSTTTVEEQIHLPEIPFEEPVEPIEEPFVINKLTDYEGPMDIDGSAYSEEWSELKMCDYLQFYPDSLSVSAAWGMEYSPKESYKVKYYDDGSICEDIADFTFVGDGNRQITVFAGKVSRPRDSFDRKFMFTSKDPYRIEIDLGETLDVIAGDFKVGDSIPVELHYIIADFECGGVHYRIQTRNLPEAAAESIIREIAKRKISDENMSEDQ